MDSRARETGIQQIIRELSPGARPQGALGPAPSVGEANIGVAARRGFELGYRLASQEEHITPGESTVDLVAEKMEEIAKRRARLYDRSGTLADSLTMEALAELGISPNDVSAEDLGELADIEADLEGSYLEEKGEYDE